MADLGHGYPNGSGLRDLDPTLLPSNGGSLLHVAASGGNVSDCVLLVEGTFSDENMLETLDLRSRTPLAAALLNGRLDTSRYLLRQGASTDAMYTQNTTIKQYLDSYAGTEFAVSLVKEGIAGDCLTPNEVFLMSARDGDKSLMLACLEQYQVDASHSDTLGRTALHETCQLGHFECTALLIQHQARLDVFDNSESTPLHYACRQGHKNTVNILVTAYGQTVQGVVNRADSAGRTPLHVAAEYHHMEVLLLLLQAYSCDTEAPDNCGVTVQQHMYQAYLNDKMDVASLVPFAAYLTQDFLDTLLHQAVFLNQVEVASQLIMAGARLDQFDPSANHTPLLLAARLGEADMVTLLLQEGASATATDATMQTPLHLAARCCHDGTVARLLQEDTIDVNAIDRRGYSAFYYALEKKHAPTVECFLDHYKAQAANPCPEGGSVIKVLDLLADWEDERILNRTLPLLGDVVAALTVADSVQSPQPKATTGGFINPDQVQKLNFTSKQKSPYPPSLQRRLLKAQTCKSIICLFCLGIVPKKLFHSHFNRRAGSCRGSRGEQNSEDGRKWFNEASAVATAQQILSLNKTTLAKVNMKSTLHSKKSEGISKVQQLAKNMRIWQHLHNSAKLPQKVRSPGKHTFPLHKAAHAGNAPFLMWVLRHASSPNEQQHVLTCKNAARQTVMEIVMRKGFQKKITPVVDHTVFENLIQDVNRLLLPSSKEKTPSVAFRRTWSMRVREDVKTTQERTQDIIQKKKQGSRMRLTDSDYTLLCHSLYHQPMLSHDDSEHITNILVSRLRIAGSRTTPCTCRCSVHSNRLHLHRAIHLVLQCYCEGVQPERLRKIIYTICLHRHLDKTLQWKEIEKSLDAPQKLMQWWVVFSRMVQSHVPDLFTAVCMFGDVDQAKVLLPWSPEGILTQDDPDMELNALEHAVRRTQPSLLCLLLEELSEEQVAEIDSDGSLLVLCCYGDLQGKNCSIFKKLSANQDISTTDIQPDTGDMWCLDFEQRRRQILDLLLSRQSYMASPDSLDTALCEAVQRGWWWGASQLVAAGARAHAAYNTTVYRGIQRKEVTLTRYAVVDCLLAGQTDTFCALLSGVSIAMLQNADFVAELVNCLPRMAAEGLHKQVSSILHLLPSTAVLWEGMRPPACQLAQVCQMMGLTLLEVPFPEQLQDCHLRTMAKYGMTDLLATALQRVSLPCGELCYSHLVHLAASSGQLPTVEVVYEHLLSYGTGIQKELQAIAAWSISAPWSDSESLFWSIVLYTAASFGHEGLALSAITKILSAALNMAKCMTGIQSLRWGYTVLHWVCYWGMEDLLVQVGNLPPEHFTALNQAPLTPLDCAIGMASLSAVATFVSPAAITTDLTSHYFLDLDESNSSSIVIPLPRGNGFHLSVQPCIAALFHLLTLGWFTRLMESNRLASTEGMSQEGSDPSVLRLHTEPITVSDQPAFAASIDHFLRCLVQGEDTVVSAFLSGLKLPALSESLLMLLVESSSVPIFQLAARSHSVSTVVTLLGAFSKELRNVINFTCPSALWPALFISAQHGNAPITAKLLSHGANVGHRDKQKQNVLHVAVASGSVETVKHLLYDKHSKILVLETNAFGLSPLQIAIQTGSYDVVFAMKELVPAKRWREQTQGLHTCSGWFDYLMKQNALGWKDQGFTVVPSATYNLRAGTQRPLKMALKAAQCNHSFILYSILRICTDDLAKQLCDTTKAYSPAFAEVALTQEDTFLPHIRVPPLVQCMKAGHEKSMVQLLSTKFRHDPLYLTNPNALAETGECFKVACEIGSMKLLSCLMEFGVLGNLSETALMDGLKDMILLGHVQCAAQFLSDASLSLLSSAWNWDHFPLIFQSIFNPYFDLTTSFDWKKIGHHAFQLQDVWLSYKGWTQALLQLVQSTNHSLEQVASLRMQNEMALPVPNNPPVSLTVDWQAFDKLSDEMRSCSCLQHCPLLTECVVFSSLVVHGLVQLCMSTSEEEKMDSVHMSVAVDKEPDLLFMDGSCHVRLSYLTQHRVLAFPELPGPVCSPCPVQPVPHFEVADVIQEMFCHSLKSALDRKHELICNSRDIEEEWVKFPKSHDAILAVVMHLAADLEDVLLTLLAPSFQLFPEASGPHLVDSPAHTAGRVLQSSYSSLVSPVLKRLKEVHVKLVVDEETAFCCTVEDSVLELTYKLVVESSSAMPRNMEGSSPDAVLTRLATCLLQTRSEELVTTLCCRLRRTFAVFKNTLGDTDITIRMPDGQLLENVEETKLQAAMLKWLLSPASSLMSFLELVDVTQNITAFKASFRNLLQNGLHICLQESGCFGFSTKMGVFSLTVPVVGAVLPLDTLFANLAASCSVPSRLHSLAALERFVYPSKCQLTKPSATTLQYATVGTLEFSVSLFNCSGAVIKGEPSNLTSVDIVIMSPNASKLVHCKWRPNVPQQSVPDQLLSVRLDPVQCCIVCVWKAQDIDCHSVRIRVNGTDISHSPFKVFVGNCFKSVDHCAMTVPNLSLPSPYLTHNLNQMSHWFLAQDHRGATSCGTGRSLVFLLSHAHGKECTSVPKASVPARVQRTPTGDIITAQPPTYSRLPSFSGNAPSPQPGAAHTQSPQHFLTICAQRGGYSRWLSFSAGNVQVLVLPKSGVSTKDIASSWKQKIRVHSVKLDSGRYRLAVLQPCCGTFYVMAACARCQEVLQVHCDPCHTASGLSTPIFCTVVPGLVNPHYTILANSVAEVQAAKRGDVQNKDSHLACEAGEQATFYGCLRDIFYNCLTSESALGSLSLSVVQAGRRAALHSPPPNAPCTIHHIENGIFEATCTPYTSGLHPIMLGKTILPLNLLRVSHVAPSVNTTTWSHPSSVHLNKGQWTCVINLRDTYGNPVINGNSSISITAVLNGIVSLYTKVHQVPKSQGTYRGTVSFSGAGVYEVTVKVGGEPLSGIPVRFTVEELTADKYAELREYLKRWWCQGSTPTMTVDRANILERAINLLTDEVLPKIIRVRFKDEPGIDVGGVSREFFELLGEALVNPNYALFEEVEGRFRPNPNSSINPNHLFYFKFTGKILAKAVADGHLLTVRFTPTLYKYLCGQPCSLDDLREEDPTLHSGLLQVSQCGSGSELSSLHLTFTAQRSRFGSVQTAELEPGGATREVSLDNKDEYLQKIVEYYLHDSIKEQLKQLKEGFNVLIPSHLLVSFSAKELEWIISGEHGLNISVLQKRTKYMAGYSRSSEVIQWLWEVLDTYSEKLQSNFLLFCTGSSSVPASFVEWHLGISRTHNEGQLPTASTCSRVLFLPDYNSKMELKEKLTQAVSMGAYSFHLH